MKSFGKKNRRKICRDLLISIILGLTIGTAMLLSILISSNGIFPHDVCHFVENDAGLLPINPNEGGTQKFSCNPQLVPTLFYIFYPALIIFTALFVLIQLLRLVLNVLRRRTKIAHRHGNR